MGLIILVINRYNDGEKPKWNKPNWHNPLNQPCVGLFSWTNKHLVEKKKKERKNKAKKAKLITFDPQD